MLRRFIFSILISLSSPVLAHNHAHKHDQEPPAPVCNQPCQDDVKKITAEFHELLEGGEHHHHSFQESLKELATRQGFAEWVRGFNFKKTGLNAYRIYQIKSANPKIRNHVANLALVFPVSHMIEMASGPIATALSAGAGMPEALTGMLGVAGTIISVPGLDPLCILIYAAYPASPRMQNSLTYVRVKGTAFFNFAGTYSGVKKLWQPVRSWAQKIWNERALESLQVNDDGVTVFADPDFLHPVLYMNWNASGETAEYFSDVQFTPELLNSLPESEWKRLLKALPYNVRAAITDARQILSKQIEIPFYVQSVDHPSLKVEWAPRSVKPDRSLRTCRELLSSAPVGPPLAL